MSSRPALSPGVNRPGREADHSFLTSAEMIILLFKLQLVFYLVAMVLRTIRHNTQINISLKLTYHAQTNTAHNVT
jgi:hypothetical protein